MGLKSSPRCVFFKYISFFILIFFYYYRYMYSTRRTVRQHQHHTHVHTNGWRHRVSESPISTTSGQQWRVIETGRRHVTSLHTPTCVPGGSPTHSNIPIPRAIGHNDDVARHHTQLEHAPPTPTLTDGDPGPTLASNASRWAFFYIYIQELVSFSFADSFLYI
jgi:hypothetical protein